MAFGVAKFAGPASIVIVVVAAAAAASGSVPAATSGKDGAPGEWQKLTIHATSQGSGTGEWAEPGPAVERLAAGGEPAGNEATAEGPRRLTGLAGPNLNQALAGAGVPESVAQDYLRGLGTRIRLSDGISVADRFDLVIDGTPGNELLVYAGLDRVGAPDVQLMRWSSGGKSSWVDATSNAAAEVMRMPVSARVSSSFGMRMHPILNYQRFHRGVDLKAAAGTPIRAPADGRVTYAGWSGGYGRQVKLGHGDGLATTFSHMSRIAARPGTSVRAGEVIGYVGSSGLSTGPHLHYEVFKNGRPVNPMTARTIGERAMGREELHAFNARLRALLTSGRRS